MADSALDQSLDIVNSLLMSDRKEEQQRELFLHLKQLLLICAVKRYTLTPDVPRYCSTCVGEPRVLGAKIQLPCSDYCVTCSAPCFRAYSHSKTFNVRCQACGLVVDEDFCRSCI